MITLKQLRYLSALAQHGHFGKAAKACAVTQPALSMQIQELEAGLGVALVERRPGEASLTDVGLEVARRAERVLAATRDLADFAQHRGRLLTGRMQLGVIPSIAPYVLPKILPVLQRRWCLQCGWNGLTRRIRPARTPSSTTRRSPRHTPE